MTDPHQEPPPLRRLSPTGAPAVGEPPVAVAAVLRVARGQDDDAALARAERAFPGVGAGTLRRALDVGLDEASPTPSWPDALALAVPLGIGAMWAACGLALGSALLLGGAFQLRFGGPPGGTGLGGVAVVLVVCGLMALFGVSLVRLRGAARFVALGLHGLGLLVLLAAVAIAGVGEEPVLGPLAGAAVIGGMFVGLLHPRTAAWFSPEGRLAVAALPARPYLAAVGASQLLVGALLFVVPGFEKVFKEVGLTLSAPTELVLSLSAACRVFGWLAGPAVVVGLAPLLRQPLRRESALLQAALLGAFFALGSIGAALTLPLIELIQKL